MAQQRELGLRRGVGLGLLASVLFTNLATAVFVSLGVVADEALGLTPAVFVVAGVVFLLMMLAYIEGITMLPRAGGATGFTRRGLGELPSFFAGWALILDYLIIVVLTSYFAVHYLGSIPKLSWLLASPADNIATAVLIVGVALVALRGVKTGQLVSIAVSVLALVGQLLLAVVGLIMLRDPDTIAAAIDLGTTPSWDSLLFALPIAMIGFTGLDTVANLGEEFEKPGRDIPRPLIWSAVVSVGVFVLMSVVALDAQPVTKVGEAASTPLGRVDGWVDRPVIGIVDALDVGSGIEGLIRTLFGVLAACVLFLAASSAIAGMSRTAYFMSRHRQAPSMLFRIDRSTGVPRRAIAVLSCVALVLLGLTVSLSDSAVVLAQMYAFGASLTATLAGIAVLRLRFTEPDLERPFRAPLEVRIRGVRVSLLAVAGTAGSFAMWIIVLATHDAARVVGLTWMVFGFVAYGTYRFTHGHSLTLRANPREYASPRIDAQAYCRVLVAVRPDRGLLYGAGDAELIGLADKLSEQRDGRPAQIAVMLVHELALADPLDAPLGSIERETSERLTLIRKVANKLDIRISSSVTRARAAGRAICQEAQRRDADAVMLASRTKRRKGDEVFGKCVAYVLRHAPCDVVILSLPEETLRRAAEQPQRTAALAIDAVEE